MNKDLIEIGNCLIFEKCEENKNVFNYGDTGDYFYIIIKGVVTINIPNTKI